MKYLVLICVAVFLAGCNNETNTEKEAVKSADYEKKIFKDDFTDSIQSFWRTNQITHPDRLQIVEDPLDPSNKVMKIAIEMGDRIAKGYRNEIVVSPKDSFGYLNKYSYRFMFPDSFFKTEAKKGIIVLNQWHDEPYPGFTWATKKIKARPPFAMYVEHTPEGEFYMVLHSGVKMGNVNEMKISRWPGKLEPNKWYTFETEIFWSIYEDGFVKPKINDVCFEFESKPHCTFQATNMYHKIPNYYKMGLYWSGTQENNRHIFYDDFEMVTERIGYFPPNFEEDASAQ